MVSRLSDDDLEKAWDLLLRERDPAILGVLAVALQLSHYDLAVNPHSLDVVLDRAKLATLHSIIRDGTPVERRIAALSVFVQGWHDDRIVGIVQTLLRTEDHEGLLRAALDVVNEGKYEGWQFGESPATTRQGFLDLFFRLPSAPLPEIEFDKDLGVFRGWRLRWTVRQKVAFAVGNRSGSLEELLTALRRARPDEELSEFALALAVYDYKAAELRDPATVSEFVRCYSLVRHRDTRLLIVRQLKRSRILESVVDQLRSAEVDERVLAQLKTPYKRPN